MKIRSILSHHSETDTSGPPRPRCSQNGPLQGPNKAIRIFQCAFLCRYVKQIRGSLSAWVIDACFS